MVTHRGKNKMVFALEFMMKFVAEKKKIEKKIVILRKLEAF